jgi:predicted transcriptional regulator
LLEAASERPLKRAAAAVALGRELDPQTKKRVADVAAATASPRLRVVLEAVERDAEDDAVTDALAALAEEDDVARHVRGRA